MAPIYGLFYNYASWFVATMSEMYCGRRTRRLRAEVVEEEYVLFYVLYVEVYFIELWFTTLL